MSKKTKFLEILANGADTVEGVVAVDIDGFTTIHVGWLKLLLDEAGHGYREVPS